MNHIGTFFLFMLFTVPLNAALMNIEDFQKLFESMSSYRVDPLTGMRSISSEENTALLEASGMPLTADQDRVYKKLWDVYFNGRVPWEQAEAIYPTFDNEAAFARELANALDKNHSGIIDINELATCIDVIKAHKPHLSIDYNEVLLKTDKNQDGQIEITEFEAWIQNLLAN